MGAVDPLGEVNAEKRERRIRHRIYQASDQRSVGPQIEVLAAERNDLDVARAAHQARDAIRVKSAARDQVTRCDGPLRSLDVQKPVASPDGLDAFSAPNLSAFAREKARHLLRHPGEVDDRRAWRMDRAHGAGMRLDFPETLSADHLESRNSVGLTSLEQGLEPRQLGVIGCDNDFSAPIDGDAVRLAELHHAADALDAKPRLVGAGLVVDPRVDDAAVVPRLMSGDARLFFNDGEREPRKSPRECQGGRQPYNSSSNHRNV